MRDRPNPPPAFLPLLCLFAGLVGLAGPVAPASAADCRDYGAGMRWVARVDFGFSGDSDITFQGDYAYVAMGEIGVLDVSDPEDPRFLGLVSEGWFNARGICADGGLLATAVWDGGAEIYSLADPADPLWLARSPLGYRAAGVHLSDGILYVASVDRGLVVFDLADPAAPVEIANVPGDMDFVRGQGDYLYTSFAVGGHAVVAVFDVSNPASPLLTHTWGDGVRDVVPNGDRLYVGLGLGGFAVLDIGDPAHPVEIGTHDTPNFVRSANGFGDYVFPVFSSQSEIGCWRAPGSPPWDMVGALPTAFGPNVLKLHAGYAYVPGNYELEVFDLSNPEGGPELLGYYDDPVSGLMHAVAAGGGFAFVANDGDYVGQKHIEAFDVRDPANPVQTDVLVYSNRAPNHLALGGGYLYSADFMGVDVVDVSDPAAIHRAGRVDTPGSAERVALAGDLLLISDGAAGLQIASIAADPAAPVLVGNVDFFQDTREVAALGSLALVLLSDATLNVIDVSDPANPVEVAELGGFPYGGRIAVRGTRAYVGAGIEVFVVDLIDPAAPAVTGSVTIPGYVAEMAVFGNALYVAAGPQGLQVVDVSDPFAPRHAGGLPLELVSRGVAVSDGTVCVASESRLNLAPLDCRSITASGGGAPAIAPIELAAHPNPFNPTTRIRFVLDAAAAVDLAVHDASGRSVRTLLAGSERAAGAHSVDWDGRTDAGAELASGVYLLRLRAGERSAGRKLTLLR